MHTGAHTHTHVHTHTPPPSRTPRTPLSASSPPCSPPSLGAPSRCLWSLLPSALSLRPSPPRCPLLEGLPTALTPLAPPPSARTPNPARPTPDSQVLEPVSSESREHAVPREGGERSSFEARKGRGLAPVSAPPPGSQLTSHRQAQDCPRLLSPLKWKQG